MPIHYNANPELNVAFLIGTGLITTAECFEAIQNTFSGEPSQHSLVRIVDVYSAVLQVELNDLRSANAWATALHARVANPKPVFILSRDKGIHLLVESMKILSPKLDQLLSTYYTLEDVLNVVGLSDRKQAVYQFWETSKSQQ